MPYNEDLFVDLSQPSSFEELASMHLDQKPVKNIVQPPVKPPKGKLRRNTKALQFMLRVVAAIMKHPQSLPFRQPVNTLQLKIPNYHTIIKHPMDFSTIRQRIRNFYYYNVKECIRDIRLVFYNCYIYNRPDDEIISMAKTIEEIFVGEMKNCPDEEEILIPSKPSKGKGVRKQKKIDVVNIRIGTSDSETATTSDTFSVESDSGPSLPTNQANNKSQLWSCPECGYHSERSQDFLKHPLVGRTSIIQTQQQSSGCTKTKAPIHKPSESNSTWNNSDKDLEKLSFKESSQKRARSSSSSSDSSSSSINTEKNEIIELKRKLRELEEKLEHQSKELNEDKKRKREHKDRKKLRNEASVVKPKVMGDYESSPVAVLHTQNVSAPASSNDAVNKLSNLKGIQKSACKAICFPKPATQPKKGAPKCISSLKPATQSKKGASEHTYAKKRAALSGKDASNHICAKIPTAQNEKRKSSPRLRKKLTASAVLGCPPTLSISKVGESKMVTENGNSKKMTYEEKIKLCQDIENLKGKAMATVIAVVNYMEPSCCNLITGEEVEIDFNALKLPTLRKLQKYIENLKKDDSDDDTSSSSSNSSSSSHSSSTTSSSSVHFMYFIDKDSSSNNISINGEINSTANAQSTATTTAVKIKQEAPDPDSTTSPYKNVDVESITPTPNPICLSPNVQKTCIKKEPYFEDNKLSLPGPSRNCSVILQRNIVRASHINLPRTDPKEIFHAACNCCVNGKVAFTRITNRVEQDSRKAHLGTGEQRMTEAIEKAKTKMKMRFEQLGNEVDQPGKEGIKIKKEI